MKTPGDIGICNPWHLLVLIIFLIGTPVQARVIHVDATATGGATGDNWADAYATVYEAINAAVAQDTIWVAAGIYYPEIQANPRLSEFLVNKEITLLGGFSGTESLVTERDPDINPVILSGDVGIPGDSTDNVYNVVSFGFGNTFAATIDGFIIEGGSATGGGGDDVIVGGGIHLNGSDNKTISNCVFRNNIAEDRGGAVFVEGCANILITDCLFKNNHQVIYTFSANGGGALGGEFSTVTISGCVFEVNSAAGSGGAFFGDNNNYAFTNCKFINNSAGGNGGAINNYHSMSNCVIRENIASSGYGGGVYQDNSSATINNCVFYNNAAPAGGALTYAATSPSIVNTIFLHNEATINSDGVYGVASNTSHDISYSRVEPDQAGTLGSGNFTDDPLISPDTTFYLLPNSPCIDAGDGGSAPANDFFGKSRRDDLYMRNTGTGLPDYTDVGILEFQGNSSLNGNYTIGAAGDFTSFTQATDSLVTLGISDSVTFNVEPGTYNEQIILPEIAGATDTSEVIFQSLNEDSTTVILTYGSSQEDANFTVKLDGADYITFRQMTLQSTGSAYARIIESVGETRHNSFMNNRFSGVENMSELVYKDATVFTRDSFIVFNDNLFLNGKSALHWSGAYSMTVAGNTFMGQSENGLLSSNGNILEVVDNLYYSTHSISAINLVDCRIYYKIEKNRIYLMNGGAGVIGNGRKLADTDTSTFINNYIYMLTNNPDAAADFTTTFSTNLKCLHNTINIAGSAASSVCFRSTFPVISRNNNYVNKAGGPVLSGSTARGDYNNYYTSGPLLFVNDAFASLEMYQVLRGPGTEDHSLSVNPYFTTDTSWIPTHPALKSAGIGTGVVEDIAGIARNMTSPDIGAAVFMPPTPNPFHGDFRIGGASPDFGSLNEAVDAMIINGIDGPVIFSIESDTLREFTRIPEINGATEINTITFTSVFPDTAVIQSDHRYNILLDGSSHLIFNGLKIDNTYGLSYYEMASIVLENGVTNVRFMNNEFTRNKAAGGAIHSAAGVDSNIVIAGNAFYQITTPIRFDGNESEYETGNMVMNNTFRNCNTRCILVNGQSNAEIGNNKIFSDGTYTHGIWIAGSENTLVFNNIINIKNETGTLYGLYTDQTNQLGIYHNSIKVARGAAMNLGGSNADLRNNILVTASFGQSLICNDTAGFSSDYNVYWANRTGNTYMTWQGHDIFSNEAWQDSCSGDENSMWILPQFLSANDLHIDDLRLNYMGTPIAEVTTDFDGELRDILHPDIGADEVDLGVPMAGEYPVGPSREIKSFSEAVDSMVQVGLAGPVQFILDQGVYSEQLSIPEIPLSDDIKNVTFRSAVTDSNAVKITFEPAETDPQYTVLLEGADNIRFEGISFENTSIDSRVIEFRDGANNNMVSGCHLSSPSTEHSLIFSDGGKDSNNSFFNNYFEGGGFGIYFMGDVNDSEEENVIANNQFFNQYKSGIYMKYQKWNRITGNLVSHPEPVETFWVGIYILNSNGYYLDEQVYQKSLVANNMIDFNATTMSVGIALTDVAYHSIFHNSVHVYGNADDSRSLNTEGSCSSTLVYNNIFSNKANGIIYYATASGINYDHNILYSSSDKFVYTNTWLNTLSDWQATGQGMHSINMDPGFVSDVNLHTNNLELMGKGIAIADIADFRILTDVTDDYDGDPRNPEIHVPGADIIHKDGDPLVGEYFVGSGADYETLDDALIEMTGRGVDGTVTLSVMPGAYNWQTYLSASFPGYDPDKDSIIIRSSSGVAEDVVISFEAQPEKNYVMKVNGLDNFILDHITLEALNSTSGRLLEISGNAHNGSYEGNVFKGVENAEINDQFALVYSPDGSVDSSLHFLNNQFFNGSIGISMGITNTNEDELEIRGNQFNRQSQGMTRFANIMLVDIVGNTVFSDHNTFSAIRVGFGCDSLNIRKNEFLIDSASNGQLISQARSTLLANNAYSLHTEENARTFVIAPYNDIYIYHNTMRISGDNSNSYFYYMGSNSCNRFVQKNNILANLAGGMVSAVHFNISDVYSDHNNLFTNGNSFGRWESITYANTNEYATGTGLDGYSFSANPNFLDDPDWYSHHVLLNNTGEPIQGITTDLEGSDRNTLTPDIGALEFEEGVFSIGSDQAACSYDSYTINAGTGFDSYQWSTGSDSNLVVLDTTGTGPGAQVISVVVTVGGSSYKDTVIVTFLSPVAAPITDYCFNNDRDTIHITAGEGTSWYWNREDTTQTIAVDYYERSYFNVTVTDSIGCVDEGTIYIHYNECLADLNIEGDTTITVNEQLSLSAHQCTDDPMFEYAWSTGDQTYDIDLTGNDLGIGDHTVWVNVLNGFANYCGSSDTLLIHVEDEVSTDLPEVPGLHIYPNPTSGKLYVDADAIRAIEVFTMDGVLLIQTNKINEIDLGQFPSGSYLLRIESIEGVSVRKIQLIH